METARLKLQGIYGLLAGLVLLIVIPVYQMTVLGPAGYQAPAATAFNQGNYGPLLAWISNHGSVFIIYRFLEIIAFLLAIRLPLALYRALRTYGGTLARWLVVGGIGGLGVFAAMIAVGTVSFARAAADYSQTGSTQAAKDIATSFNTLYFVEGLAQNTLGGALIATFLVCASLLIARSGKLSGLLVFFGLLVAALMAALAVLFAVSAPAAQMLPTPAILSFAVWLIWLGILLIQRARRFLAAPANEPTQATQQDEEDAPISTSTRQEESGQANAASPQPRARKKQAAKSEPSDVSPEATS